MLLQLDFFCGLCTIFFGQFSWAMHLMTSLITALEKNKHSFKARERTNPHFCSKFMYAIDTRFQLWLEVCMLQTQWNRIDDSILNFTSLIEQVRFGTFKLKLPSPFSEPSKPPTKDTIATPKQKGKGKQKEDGDDGKRKKEREINRFGNHKGASLTPELLTSLINNIVVHGFAIPFHLKKMYKIPGILSAPLNIQEQNTINSTGRIVP
jgi:hypothetical protein